MITQRIVGARPDDVESLRETPVLLRGFFRGEAPKQTIHLKSAQAMVLEAVIEGPLFDTTNLAPIADDKREPPPIVFGQGALFVLQGEQPQLDQHP